ncbi:MAG TPA: hypothetical protein VK051_01760 [Paenalcaligenes sp.]|nr:hypothetical protein [Paenalcaligenes sp.]
MLQKTLFSACLALLFLVAACTPQEKQVLHDIEDMPGITCEVDEQSGLDDCHPDNLETTFEDDSPGD